MNNDELKSKFEDVKTELLVKLILEVQVLSSLLISKGIISRIELDNGKEQAKKTDAYEILDNALQLMNKVKNLYDS